MANAKGATITDELEDKPYGDRLYAALDPGGHQWFFATHVREVPLAEAMPQAAPDD